ncbi:MAG: hypothetical protein ACR2QE_05515 [Acidimicrobiales bacterium]
MKPLKKAAVAGVAGLSLAGGSLAIAAVSPLGIAGAQEDETEQTSPEGRIASGLAEILAELVDEGTLTQDQADAVTERAEEKGAERRAEFEAQRAEREAQREETAAAIAEAAGVTVEELQAARENGDSLADIAGDNVDAVIALLVQEQTDRINEAVENGRIDSERADEVLAEVEQRVTDMVNGEGGFGRGGFGRGPGHRFPGRGGFGPGADAAPEDAPAAFDTGA